MARSNSTQWNGWNVVFDDMRLNRPKWARLTPIDERIFVRIQMNRWDKKLLADLDKWAKELNLEVTWADHAQGKHIFMNEEQYTYFKLRWPMK